MRKCLGALAFAVALLLRASGSGGRSGLRKNRPARAGRHPQFGKRQRVHRAARVENWRTPSRFMPSKRLTAT